MCLLYFLVIKKHLLNDKVHSLLAKLRDEGKIINIGVNKLPKWIISEHKIDQNNNNQ